MSLVYSHLLNFAILANGSGTPGTVKLLCHCACCVCAGGIIQTLKSGEKVCFPATNDLVDSSILMVRPHSS